jgi:hypothetical protein
VALLPDRPRVVSSLKLSHPAHAAIGAHAPVSSLLYGEVTGFRAANASGKRATSRMPGDSGALVGAQLGMFTGERDGS